MYVIKLPSKDYHSKSPLLFILQQFHNISCQLKQIIIIDWYKAKTFEDLSPQKKHFNFFSSRNLAPALDWRAVLHLHIGVRACRTPSAPLPPWLRTPAPVVCRRAHRTPSAACSNWRGHDLLLPCGL